MGPPLRELIYVVVAHPKEELHCLSFVVCYVIFGRLTWDLIRFENVD